MIGASGLPRNGDPFSINFAGVIISELSELIPYVPRKPPTITPIMIGIDK